MRYVALATDYDETLAEAGLVRAETVQALERLRTSGRQILLVTGREIEDLKRVFDRLDLFALVIGENGGVVFDPQSGVIDALGPPPDERLVQLLASHDVQPLQIGHVVAATREPHEETVVGAIRDLGLELQVIFNKGAVMILPAGINKASGLHAALERLGLSAHNVVAVGDAENDHAFLAVAEAGAAVANAVPSLRDQADLVLSVPSSTGVEELIAALIADDLRSVEQGLSRHDIPFGVRADGTEWRIPAFGQNVLITGSSGGGKSSLTVGLIERLMAADYQFCLVDPEGDYPQLPGALTLGSLDAAPSLDELEQALHLPKPSVVVNLLAVPLTDRPAFFEQITMRLRDAHVRFARPHWLVVDEAHHMIRAEAVGTLELQTFPCPTMLVTPHPELVPVEVLAQVDVLVTVGPDVANLVGSFARLRGVVAPTAPDRLDEPEAFVWSLRSGMAEVIEAHRSEREHRRHQRKYAEGELGEQRSFYFRGPHGRLNLRAQNLMIFLQIADGVDDESFLYHLHRGDYSRWFEEQIKDAELAVETRKLEEDAALTAGRGRRVLRELVEARYTLPATAPTGSEELGPDGRD
jgi:hydroxymethylpyrimidine pyrophosphatase-like HAD family hydrolase